MRALFLPLAAMLLLAPVHSHPSRPYSGLSSVGQKADRLAEYEKRREEAGEEADALWDLYLWCDAYAMDKQGRSCLRAIIKVDPGHRAAHEGLKHVEFDGKWFTSRKKLDKYKAAEELRIAKEQGLVKYKGEWVAKGDVDKLKQGLVRDDDGAWVTVEVFQKQEQGWVKQDTTWIAPDEQAHMADGLWKCGDTWLSLEEANDYHSDLGYWWITPTEWFTVYSTLDREVVMKAIDHLERAYRDVEKALGKPPEGPVRVMLLRNIDQYRAFAVGWGDQPATETKGLSSVHWGFFADAWITGDEPEFLGCGVGYWDDFTEGGPRFGVHSVRHAAALSLLEALDASPKALTRARKDAFDDWDGQDYWKEKKLPAWFRHGMASYVDRYFVDPFASKEKYNWAREWSVKNLISKGGLRPLEEIFEGELSPDRREDSVRLMNELGLVLAFALDGQNEEVTQAYGAAREAFRAGKGSPAAFKNLRKAITQNEKALREFAGL